MHLSVLEVRSVNPPIDFKVTTDLSGHPSEKKSYAHGFYITHNNLYINRELTISRIWNNYNFGEFYRFKSVISPPHEANDAQGVEFFLHGYLSFEFYVPVARKSLTSELLFRLRRASCENGIRFGINFLQ